MPITGIDEFKEVMADFKSITSYALTAMIAAPLADFTLNLGPPWPPGIPFVSSLTEFIALVSIFHFWFRVSQQKLNRRLIVLLIILGISFSSYLSLFGFFTFINPSSQKRYVKGFVIRKEIQTLIPEPFQDSDEALESYEYDPQKIWEGWSVTAVNIAMAVNWIILFSSVSAFVGTFVLAQRRRIIHRAIERGAQSNQPLATTIDSTNNLN